MSRAPFASDFKTDPYWWDDAAPFAASGALPDEVDCVIVGAGFCGLSAASRALDLGAVPLVVDRGAIAGGASGRSGAMLSAGQKLLISGALERLPVSVRDRWVEAHGDAFAFVKGLAESGRYGDVFQASGRLILAAVPDDLARFRSHAGLLAERAGLSARVLGREDLSSEIATTHYHGGLLIERFGGLHPSRFATALAREVAARGGALRSHVAVDRVERTGRGFRVRTDAGEVRAQHVLFATNGHADRALPRLRDRVAPVGSYMIATSPLPAERIAALMPGARMYSDTKRNLWYFRPSPDGRRLLFGARPGLAPQDPEEAGLRLHAHLLEVFPSLDGVTISHAWKGVVAMTRTRLQHIGQIDGCWYATGCNGSGVGIMPWLGRLALERMVGHRPDPTVFETSALPRLPQLAGWPWYLPLAAGAASFADWRDRVRARA